MTESTERAPECCCLSDRLQSMFGAFATVPVLYFLHLRMTGRQELPDLSAGHCHPEALLPVLQQFWKQHASILNPVLKLAGTKAPSEECLLAVLSALRTDRMSKLPADSLTDTYYVSADPARQKSARKKAMLFVSSEGNITVQKIKYQSRKKSRRKSPEAEPIAAQLICYCLNIRGKVMLCSGLNMSDDDLSAITGAQGDYICILPFSDFHLYDITPEDVSYYLRTYLESDTAKELCLSEDQHSSGFFRRCTDQDGNTVTESVQQSEFMSFVDYFVAISKEEALESYSDKNEEERELMAGAFCYDLRHALKRWPETGTRSLLYQSYGKQATACISSLPCRHQKDYLLRLQPLLQHMPEPEENSQIFTLTDLASADDRLQADMLNLQANLQQADTLAEQVLTVALALLQKIRASAVSPEELHSVFCSNQDAAIYTALYFLRAYYTDKDNQIRKDPLLQGTLLQNVSASAEQT